MNPHLPPTPADDSLDRDERELARLVHALPAGEPSPALDARILNAAAAAVAAKRRRHWFASPKSLWGLSSAAAAVLAIGLSWQMQHPRPRAVAPVAPMLRSTESTARPSPFVELKQEAIEQDQVPMPTLDQEEARPPAAFPAQQAKTQAPVSPPPPPAVVFDQPIPFTPPATAPAEPAPLEEGRLAETPIDVDVAEAAVTAGTADSMNAEPPAAKELARARAEKTSPTRQDIAKPNDPLAADATSSLGDDPAVWLEAIRQLRNGGHIEQAKNRLREFQARFPEQEIPADLVPLLHE